VFLSRSELSLAGFDRSLRCSVTGLATPWPHRSPPWPRGSPGREEERQLICGVGEEEWAAGSEAKEAIQAATCPEHPLHTNPGHAHVCSLSLSLSLSLSHTQTQTLPHRWPPLPSSLPAYAHQSAFWGPALLGHPIGACSDCPQKSLSQMPQGFDLYTLSPALARGVRGTEAWPTTPSSTFLPPL